MFGLPVPALIAPWPRLAIGAVALGWMRYGRYVTGIGANAEGGGAAPASTTRRVIFSVYVLTGLAAALGGIITAARLGSGSFLTRRSASNCR